VDQALNQGHHVTAFSRKPSTIGITDEKLALFEGDVFDEQAVSQAITGQDAVFIALGAGRKGDVRAKGTWNIIAAMKQQGVSRLICQTTLGAGDSWPALNFFWKHIMFNLLLKAAHIDHELQEQYIVNSDLDWTIIRPSAFTNEPTGRPFRKGFNTSEGGLKFKIPRVEVAAFMIEQLTDNTYLLQTPAISY
jgi:putative NADH-flavin reductase